MYIKHIDNSNLTEVVKKMFGEDIVKDVFIQIPNIFDENHEEEYEIAAVSRLDFGSSSFSYDTTIIVIAFKNGKSVRFSASEWAGMESVYS